MEREEDIYQILQEADVFGFLRRISKEGHSYPHGDICNTCLEDFIETGRFWAKYIFKKYGSFLETSAQEKFKKEFGL